MNHLIQQYRLMCYDYHAYEVSPWDVPVWWVDGGQGCEKVVLVPYAAWDRKPLISIDGEQHELKLLDPSDLQPGMLLTESPGEFELMDALNLIERGDYSGAIRRVATAIEAILSARLADLLIARHGESRGRQRHQDIREDRFKQITEYQALSAEPLPDSLLQDLLNTRKIRHEIVHHARRIEYGERGIAHRAVDTGRWIYNKIEDNQARREVREQNIVKRSIGRHFSLFTSRITPEGVIVDSPLIRQKPYIEQKNTPDPSSSSS